MSQNQPDFNPSVLVENREYLRKLARGLVFDEHRADDLVQQACLALLERPPKRAGSLRAWMASVVQNLAYSMLARESERAWRESLAAKQPQPESDGQAEERMFEEQQLLLDALRRLRQPYRSALFMRYYQDLSPTQIAGQEQIALATVKTRLRRGLELLRAELDASHSHGRGHWCLALLPLAAPLGAFKLAGASAVVAYLKGILFMKKPIVAIVSALALAGVASLTWVTLEGRGSERSQPERTPSAELPREHVAAQEALNLQLGPAGAATESKAAADRSAIQAEASAGLRQKLQDAEVSGRVVDEGGTPIAGANVRLYGQGEGFGLSFSAFGAASGVAPGMGGRETITDAAGRFRLGFESQGSMNLSVGADLFAPFRRELMLSEGASFDAGDLQLDAGAVLSGRVVDDNGGGIAGATLESLGPKSGPQVIVFGDMGSSSRVAVSDANGYFSILRHSVGPWRLRASSPDHPANEESGQTLRGGEHAEGIRITLEDGHEISGHVAGLPVDVPDGLVVVADLARSDAGRDEDMFLINGSMLGGQRVKLDAGGSFRLRGLLAGRKYRLRLMLGERVFGGKRRSEDVLAEAGQRGVLLSYNTPAALLFQVVDAKTGEPIESYDLASGGLALRSDGDRLATPDPSRLHPEGRMRLEDFQSGSGLLGDEGVLRIKSVGYEDYILNKIKMTVGQEVDLGRIRMNPVPVVRVTVLDELSGEPVAGVQVSMAPEQPTPEPNGMRAMRFSVEVGGGGNESVDFSDGSDDGRVRGVTDEHGLCVLTSLPGKNVRIKVGSSAHAPYRSELIELAPAADMQHTALLQEGSTVEIFVLDSEGNALSGMQVKHREPEGQADFDPLEMLAGHDGHSERTDSDGKLFFENLSTGRHAFALDEDPFSSPSGFSGMQVRTIGAPGRQAGGPAWHELDVEPGSVLTLTLSAAPRGTLSGVISEAGSTLAGARVRLLPKASQGGGLPMGLPGMGDGGPSTVTDSRGRYVLEAVPVDAYRLQVTHPSRQMPFVTEVALGVGRNGRDVALGVAIIEGRVVDSEGKPLPGVKVSVSEAQSPRGSGPTAMRMVAIMVDGSGSSMTISSGDDAQPVSSDADGYYQLRGVSFDKPLVVEASAGGFAARKSAELRLGDGEVLDGVDLQLESAGAAELRVLNSDGAPAGGFLATASYRGAVQPTPDPVTGFVGPDGRAQLQGLLVGKWEVQLRPLGGPASDSGDLAPLPQMIEVVAGETQPLEFVVD